VSVVPQKGILKYENMIKTLPRKAISYFTEVKSEIEKVAWPTQKMTLLYSAFVVAACLVFTLYFAVLDFGLTEIVNALLSR
jgi:preprotein translocase subunit SecE